MKPRSDYRYHQVEAKVKAENDNPDSLTWRLTAIGRLEELCKLIGSEDYGIWAEIVWPGCPDGSTYTWKEMFEQGQAAWESLEADPEKSPQELAKISLAVHNKIIPLEIS